MAGAFRNELSGMSKCASVRLPTISEIVLMPAPLGHKEQEILSFLHERIFDPILHSPRASETLKQGVRYTIMRLRERDAAGMSEARVIDEISSVAFADLSEAIISGPIASWRKSTIPLTPARASPTGSA